MLGGGDCENCIDNQGVDYGMISSSISFFVLLLELGIVSSTDRVSISEVELAAARLGLYECDIDIVLFDMCRMFRSAVSERNKAQRDKEVKKRKGAR